MSSAINCSPARTCGQAMLSREPPDHGRSTAVVRGVRRGSRHRTPTARTRRCTAASGVSTWRCTSPGGCCRPQSELRQTTRIGVTALSVPVLAVQRRFHGPLPLPRRSLMTARPHDIEASAAPRTACGRRRDVGRIGGRCGRAVPCAADHRGSEPDRDDDRDQPRRTAPYRVRRTASASCCHRSTAETSRSWSSGRWGTSALIPRMRSARRAVRTFPKPAIWSPWRRSIWLPVRTVPRGRPELR